MTFIQHIQRLSGTGNAFTKRKLKQCANAKERLRFKVFVKRDNCLCKVCNGAAHNIHHILPRKDFPHFENEIQNMISLCKPCHDKADKGMIETQKLFSLV